MLRDKRSLKREQRLTVTIVLGLISFYAWFLSYFVKVFLVFHFTTNEILFMFSLTDPVIYAWRLESFPKSFGRISAFKRSVMALVKEGSLPMTTETTTAII